MPSRDGHLQGQPGICRVLCGVLCKVGSRAETRRSPGFNFCLADSASARRCSCIDRTRRVSRDEADIPCSALSQHPRSRPPDCGFSTSRALSLTSLWVFAYSLDAVWAEPVLPQTSRPVFARTGATGVYHAVHAIHDVFDVFRIERPFMRLFRLRGVDKQMRRMPDAAHRPTRRWPAQAVWGLP